MAQTVRYFHQPRRAVRPSTPAGTLTDRLDSCAHRVQTLEAEVARLEQQLRAERTLRAEVTRELADLKAARAADAR